MSGVSERDVRKMFTPVVHRENGAYWAEIPAMPGCFTVADTPDELSKNLLEAMTCWLLTANDAKHLSARRTAKKHSAIREKVLA